MYENDRWGHRSFEICWPENEIINISDKDSKDANLATLNYVEECLNIEKQQNARNYNKSGNKMYLWGACAGMSAFGISMATMDYGFWSFPALLCTGLLGAFSISAINNYIFHKTIEDAEQEINVELSKVNEARSVIEQFR